jgi:hypothetical protein
MKANMRRGEYSTQATAHSGWVVMMGKSVNGHAPAMAA